MESPECIRLPSLHDCRSANAIRGEMRLWPGHGPAAPGAWMPPAYPLSERDASAFLEYLEQLSADDLETMRHALTSLHVAHEIRIRDEMADLLEFAGCLSGPRALELARIQAQRLLLWRWRWEEKLAEIQALEQLCQQAERKLPCELQGLEEDDCNPSLPEEQLRCAWQPVVANAAFFLPPELPLLASGEMATDLADAMEFQKTGDVASACAPLWQALGHSRPARGLASEIYNCERTWLIIENHDPAASIHE